MSAESTIPSMMYGTAWKKDETARLVKLAIKSGFTAIDTANQKKHYDEVLVGEALNEAFKSGAKRETFFIQTKYTSKDGQDHRLPYDPKADLKTQVRQSIDSSLEHLHTDYLDSYVLHGPHYRHGLGKEDWQVWEGIEEQFEAGKTRMVGCSNVSADQLRELSLAAKIKPKMVQNRCYAINGWDYEVRQICKEIGATYQGFSLLTANPQVLSHPFVLQIAQRQNATPAQIVFKFSMSIGMLPLTGTTSEKHMLEDLKSKDLELTQEEVDKIEKISS
ncbi:MAG: aldo/keto reductase [Candidatus Melainabacteria bacterium]|nr:aldo/keto reductase [Candidatus Melainabacteria bacterium]